MRGADVNAETNMVCLALLRIAVHQHLHYYAAGGGFHSFLSNSCCCLQARFVLLDSTWSHKTVHTTRQQFEGLHICRVSFRSSRLGHGRNLGLDINSDIIRLCHNGIVMTGKHCKKCTLNACKLLNPQNICQAIFSTGQSPYAAQSSRFALLYRMGSLWITY